ncbi:DUF1297 domain-containing protein [Candidatus Micrarchaeota archaeon]|nr:DUF1297 domain-containing protein [Candidatus Micrarchaeota archaeon]
MAIDGRKLVSEYSPGKISISTLGSSAALDILDGAKREGFPTIAVCAKGREKTYSNYFKSRRAFGRDAGMVDDALVLNWFTELAEGGATGYLRRNNSIFVPHHAFLEYVGLDALLNRFSVPIFGNRSLFAAEEPQAGGRDKYFMLNYAKIRTPRVFTRPQEIDRPAVVKPLEEKPGSLHSPYFIAGNSIDYERGIAALERQGISTEAIVRQAVIEELVVGAAVNLNFFSSPLNGQLEFLGADVPRQTNIDGILSLPGAHQSEVLRAVRQSYASVGYFPSTLRESLIEKGFEAAEKFAKVAKELYPPGIIGPFSLEGVIVPGPPSEEFVAFDAHLCASGAQTAAVTPYTGYYWRKPVSVGQRIAMEIREAVRKKKLDAIVS